jgi:hypothetical protein
LILPSLEFPGLSFMSSLISWVNVRSLEEWGGVFTLENDVSESLAIGVPEVGILTLAPWAA